jgi:hypothetical protein
MADPVTTIPPFANTKELPACATFCGPLYDANGACVPPVVPVGQASAYTACFCAHSTVAPFSSASAGICDEACQPDGLASIQNWFQGICGVEKKPDDNGGNNGGSDGSNGGSGGSGQQGATGANGGVNKPVPIDNGGGDWISNHWQWVIMLVVLVVGIAGIWVGACIWRRRHLKKKDRQSTLPQKQSGSVSHPSWGPDMAPGAANGGPGVFMPGSTASPAPVEEKSKGKKKWTVSQRT